MTTDVGLIALVNVLMLLLGVGLLPLLRIARTPRELAGRWPLAYGVGLAMTGLVGYCLELLHAPLGLAELSLLAFASVVGGGIRMATEQRHDAQVERPGASRLSSAVGLASLTLSLALVLHAAHAFAVRPLREYDGWVIWATKARALYEHGGADDAVFASSAYQHPDYPLLLPTLEAIALRAIGGFDGTLVHLQLIGLVLAFIGAAWTISRVAASPAVSGLTILAVVSAPAVLVQLGWNYADIPVAMLCALGVAALAAWLCSRETWLLTTATLFLGAAASTKSEGVLFALSAFVAIGIVLLVSERRRLVPVLLAFGAFIATILPWRLYVLANDLHPQDYELSSLASPGFLADASYRLRPAASELVAQLVKADNWGLLLPLSACALATAIARRRYGVAGFGTLWVGGSFAGLLAIYWISELPLDHNLFNTSYRTTATLALGLALLVPQFIGGPHDDDVHRLNESARR